MQFKLGVYVVFVTQDRASSNCSRCERRPFGNILCLVLDSCLIFRLLILQKVKSAYKTLTSPCVTLRKLSTAGLSILIPCFTSTQALFKLR